MSLEIKNQKYILFLLAVLGLVVSVELTYVYFNANFVPNAAPSFCTINDVIDCDAIAKTAYATFLGLPWAIYGICFYLFIMFISLFPFQKLEFFKNFKNPESYIFTLASIAVINSVILWGVSSLIIKKVCLLCYILYGVNFFLFVFSLMGKPFLSHYKDAFNDLIKILSDKRWLAIVIVIALIKITFLIVINVTGMFVPPKNNDLLPPGFEQETENTYKPVGNVLGSTWPRLVIQEFTDFQCPYCAISNSMMYRLVNEVGGIQVEHHDFPLNKSCNSLVKASPHKDSCKAVFYARAAKKQGKYWDYITLLFDNQENLSEAKLLELAKSINLNIEQLKKDAYSKEIKQELEDDIERAKGLNIQATPTYIIGIKKYEGLMPYPQLREVVLNNM